MIDRRRLIRFAATAVPLLAVGLRSSASRAQQSFQRFFPLLVDLQGWKAGKPDGAAMEIPGASMVTATREYRRGEFAPQRAGHYRGGRARGIGGNPDRDEGRDQRRAHEHHHHRRPAGHSNLYFQ